MFLSFYLFSRSTFSCPLSLSLSGETHFPPLQDCFSHKMEMEKTNKRSDYYSPVLRCICVVPFGCGKCTPTAKWLFLFPQNDHENTNPSARTIIPLLLRCICALRLWQEPPSHRKTVATVHPPESSSSFCIFLFISLACCPLTLTLYDTDINVCTCNKCGADSKLLLLFCCCC